MGEGAKLTPMNMHRHGDTKHCQAGETRWLGRPGDAGKRALPGWLRTTAGRHHDMLGNSTVSRLRPA